MAYFTFLQSPHSMRNRVYETVWCPSLCPSMGPQQQQEISINCCSSCGRMRAVPRCQRTYVAERRLVSQVTLRSYYKYQLSLINPRNKESCCRQSLMITVINYSGRASELGGIVNLVDQRRSSLSRSQRPSFST